MYPISAEKRLSFLEIADHWAGELGQPNRYNQLLEDLIRGWWSGQFGSVEVERRLAMLKWLYKHHRNDISFLNLDHVEREATQELPDGGVVVDISYRVPLPNEDPSLWTQANCAQAFKGLADRWTLRLIPDATDVLALFKISEADFTAYVRVRGYNRPKFWADEKNRSDSALTTVSSAQTDRVHQARGKPPVVFNRVVKEMRAAISENRTTQEGLWEPKEETLASEYGCSRDTVRKARAKLPLAMSPMSRNEFSTISDKRQIATRVRRAEDHAIANAGALPQTQMDVTC